MYRDMKMHLVVVLSLFVFRETCAVPTSMPTAKPTTSHPAPSSLHLQDDDDKVCDASGMFCKSTNVNTSSQRLSESVFLFILFVTLCSFATSLIGGRNKKSMFLGNVLLGMVAVQYYHLYSIQAISYPNHTTDLPVYRYECLDSNKGGKIARGDSGSHTVNPCNTNKTLKDNRDCEKGQFRRCSKEEPCMPCELDRAVEFMAPEIWKRCATCTPQNRGDCQFESGVGPYCYESFGSRRVVPCKRCCTEEDTITINGQCV